MSFSFRIAGALEIVFYDRRVPVVKFVGSVDSHELHEITLSAFWAGSIVRSSRACVPDPGQVMGTNLPQDL